MNDTITIEGEELEAEKSRQIKHPEKFEEVTGLQIKGLRMFYECPTCNKVHSSDKHRCKDKEGYRFTALKLNDIKSVSKSTISMPRYCCEECMVAGEL